MFIFGNFLFAAARVLDMAITVLYWLIIFRAIISWVNPDPYNTIVKILYKTTEPFLYPIKRLIPTMSWGIDLSPVIAILLLIFLQHFAVRTLIDLSYRLR